MEGTRLISDNTWIERNTRLSDTTPRHATTVTASRPNGTWSRMMTQHDDTTVNWRHWTLDALTFNLRVTLRQRTPRSAITKTPHTTQRPGHPCNDLHCSLPTVIHILSKTPIMWRYLVYCYYPNNVLGPFHALNVVVYIYIKTSNTI